MTQGYWGMALYQPKTIENWGTLLRSAHVFGASFIATIGHRYPKQASDTTKAARSIPVFHWLTMADFLASLPIEAVLVEVEVDRGQDLRDFSHPKRAVYLFGGEDRTLPVVDVQGAAAVHIETTHCLNLAVTASIVMYDRTVKGKKYD